MIKKLSYNEKAILIAHYVENKNQRITIRSLNINETAYIEYLASMAHYIRLQNIEINKPCKYRFFTYPNYAVTSREDIRINFQNNRSASAMEPTSPRNTFVKAILLGSFLFFTLTSI
ncbi:MAG: hypothetical protein HC912_02425 [Saprospiraceae bacterium]|nr:hypothetical protein [Saprospiraceae bacterium]